MRCPHLPQPLRGAQTFQGVANPFLQRVIAQPNRAPTIAGSYNYMAAGTPRLEEAILLCPA